MSDSRISQDFHANLVNRLINQALLGRTGKMMVGIRSSWRELIVIFRDQGNLLIGCNRMHLSLARDQGNPIIPIHNIWSSRVVIRITLIKHALLG